MQRCLTLPLQTFLLLFLFLSLQSLIRANDAYETNPSRCPEFRRISTNQFAYWQLTVCPTTDNGANALSWGQSESEIAHTSRLNSLLDVLNCQAALDQRFESTVHVNEPPGENSCVTVKYFSQRKKKNDEL
jgi:hypothetical protein